MSKVASNMVTYNLGELFTNLNVSLNHVYRIEDIMISVRRIMQAIKKGRTIEFFDNLIYEEAVHTEEETGAVVLERCLVGLLSSALTNILSSINPNTKYVTEIVKYFVKYNIDCIENEYVSIKSKLSGKKGVFSYNNLLDYMVNIISRKRPSNDDPYFKSIIKSLLKYNDPSYETLLYASKSLNLITQLIEQFNFDLTPQEATNILAALAGYETTGGIYNYKIIDFAYLRSEMYAKVAQYLIDAGADVNAMGGPFDDRVETPRMSIIFSTIECSLLDMIRTVLDADNVNIHTTDNIWNYTLLQMAIIVNQGYNESFKKFIFPLVEILVDRGFDYEDFMHEDNNGHNAFDYMDRYQDLKDDFIVFVADLLNMNEDEFRRV